MIYKYLSAVIESHPETAQSLHLDRPFPELLEYAMSLDFEGMDVTDHGHVPYVIILTRVLEEWKREVRSPLFFIQLHPNHYV